MALAKDEDAESVHTSLSIKMVHKKNYRNENLTAKNLELIVNAYKNVIISFAVMEWQGME